MGLLTGPMRGSKNVFTKSHVYIKFGEVRWFKNGLFKLWLTFHHCCPCGRWHWSDCEHFGTSTKENFSGECISFGLSRIYIMWFTINSGVGTDSKILAHLAAWTHSVWWHKWWVSEGLFIVWTCPTALSTGSIRIMGRKRFEIFAARGQVVEISSSHQCCKIISSAFNFHGV